jgi:predicted nucleic acid-binding protein
VILVDSSVWIDHLRGSDAMRSGLLDAGQVLSHPFVIGELALGSFRQREVIVNAMRDLPQSVVASDDEALALIDRHGLHGLGIGYIDAHLLASTRLTPGATLWTRDKRSRSAATRLGVVAGLESGRGNPIKSMLNATQRPPEPD